MHPPSRTRRNSEAQNYLSSFESREQIACPLERWTNTVVYKSTGVYESYTHVQIANMHDYLQVHFLKKNSDKMEI